MRSQERFKRVFAKFFTDMQVDTLSTYDSLFIDV